MERPGTPADRARALHHAVHAAVCDVLEPWAHGTVVRATRFPSYYDFNVVRVERDPQMSVDELAAFADEALAGLAHRRIDVEQVEVGDPLRAGFEARGWLSQRLVWMIHESGASPGAGVAVNEVRFDAVNDLRVAWHQEDFPGQPLGDYLEHARQASSLLGARVLAVLEGSTPVAYSQLEWIGRSAEIAQVYVRPDRRGRGLGTALTSAAIRAAGEADDLLIVADDAGRPKELYARLGFRPAWRAVELLRLPHAARVSATTRSP
jgi:ribosomal protein S18 acetylase RimI-like enzyme